LWATAIVIRRWNAVPNDESNMMMMMMMMMMMGVMLIATE
jgi:hypothetical protein